MQKEVKKKKKNFWNRLSLQNRLIMLIVIVAVLAIAITALFSQAPQKEETPEAVLPVVIVYNDPEDDDIEPPWYYNESRADRYEAYAERKPGIDMEDIIWMVEADLDRPAYENMREATDLDSILLLVNKHYNLPEAYVPGDLVNIGNAMLRAEAAEAMREMISDAAQEGHNLWVQSGYRSFSTQTNLYQQYSARDGADIADTYSARPGSSEHQTGLAVDFNTITDSFGERPEGIWASENSWRYGYILRYTEENSDTTLYKSEPWHFRYIGREAAAEMRELGFKTYEEYWVKYVKHDGPGLS